jgi:integrase
MPRLTKALLDGLTPGAKDATVWDSLLPGFGVRLRPGSPHKTFYVQYRLTPGQQRRRKLGAYGVLTVEEARTQARLWLAQVAQGIDPVMVASARHTMADLAARFVVEYSQRHTKPTTQRGTRSLLRLHILPVLGAHRVQEVTHAEVLALHAALHATPYQANRMLALLSRMFRLAERWGWRTLGSNPARGLQTYREHARERYLTPEECGILWKALAQADQARAQHWRFTAGIRLLLLTGARTGEMLGLQWRWIDWQHGQARLPESKTGPKSLYFAPEALDVLRHLPRVLDNPYVLPGARTGRPYTGLRNTWEHFRRTVGLDDVRLHDLRHTYAAYAAGAGVTLPQIGALLGHKHPQATARYAHIAPAVAHAAAAQTGAALARVLRGEREAAAPGDAAGGG